MIRLRSVKVDTVTYEFSTFLAQIRGEAEWMERRCESWGQAKKEKTTSSWFERDTLEERKASRATPTQGRSVCKLKQMFCANRRSSKWIDLVDAVGEESWKSERNKQKTVHKIRNRLLNAKQCWLAIERAIKERLVWLALIDVRFGEVGDRCNESEEVTAEKVMNLVAAQSHSTRWNRNSGRCRKWRKITEEKRNRRLMESRVRRTIDWMLLFRTLEIRKKIKK